MIRGIGAWSSAHSRKAKMDDGSGARSVPLEELSPRVSVCVLLGKAQRCLKKRPRRLCSLTVLLAGRVSRNGSAAAQRQGARLPDGKGWH
jgi:hypothetical protein